ncbi:MAG: hypothetical protein AABZ43_04095 [Planctomycetota bacterium]|jgi:vacuolar-type H+-ATPase subunit H
MSDHLIKEVLNIEAEADNIVNNARQKAERIIADVDNEINLIKNNLENKYHQKLELLRAEIVNLQMSEEERLKNEFESLKEKLLHIDGKSMENAVNWVLKRIYEC